MKRYHVTSRPHGNTYMSHGEFASQESAKGKAAQLKRAGHKEICITPVDGTFDAERDMKNIEIGGDN